jgi:hypothetical protein
VRKHVDRAAQSLVRIKRVQNVAGIGVDANSGDVLIGAGGVGLGKGRLTEEQAAQEYEGDGSFVHGPAGPLTVFTI